MQLISIFFKYCFFFVRALFRPVQEIVVLIERKEKENRLRVATIASLFSKKNEKKTLLLVSM